jgi:hypothetical protein
MEQYYNKEKLMKHYTTELSRMCSDADIRKWTNAPILKYSELANYKTMLDLLPNEICSVIILTESQRNSGHWCCLCRNHNEIYYFDSYGTKPDGELAFISNSIKRMLGETEHQLTRLIKTIPKSMTFTYNKIKFQELKDHIDTCGRWVLGCVKMNELGHTLKETQEFLKRTQKAKKMPYDILICDLIQLV